MLIRLRLVCLLLTAVPCGVLTAQPRLAVLIAVDQMRADFLERFSADYSGGLQRLRDDGAVFVNARHDHAFTVTAAGHATISTGTYPSHHGIVGNEFWERSAGAVVEAVSDPDSEMVGTERRSGRSPFRLQRSAIGDWLKSQSPASKVFGVSLKDRSAIFLGGIRPDGAYWYDERSGRFVTSDYYRETLPGWAVAFNAAAPVDRFFGTVWESSIPGIRHGEDADGSAALSDGPSGYSEFPHRLGGPEGSPDRRYYTSFRRSPFADRVTIDLAMMLIENEQLGADAVPDLLLIGLSAADHIGHRYGPWSEEVHDHFVRLDAYLAEFFAALDERIGRGGYLVVLTSDHGAMPVAEQLVAHGIDAVRVDPGELLAHAEAIVLEAYRDGRIAVMPKLVYESGLVFDFGSVAISEGQRELLADSVARALETLPSVDEAITYSELLRGDAGRSEALASVQRSFHADRSADVVLKLRENHVVTEGRVGTEHGSPYDYDTHVPLIFWGDRIRPARYLEPVRTVDIAPTLAALLGVDAPADVDGDDLSSTIRAGE